MGVWITEELGKASGPVREQTKAKMAQPPLRPRTLSAVRLLPLSLMNNLLLSACMLLSSETKLDVMKDQSMLRDMHTCTSVYILSHRQSKDMNRQHR